MGWPWFAGVAALTIAVATESSLSSAPPTPRPLSSAVVDSDCPVRLVMPVAGPLLEPFVAPSCPYCPGRRGVVLGSTPGAPVVAAASGEVTFAGQVAGVLWVVVQASPRVRITHGRLAVISGAGGAPPGPGDRVASGEVIGVAGPTTYLGATSGSVPVDPWPALSGRVHLVRPGSGSVGCSTPRTAPPSGSRPTPG